MMSHKCGSKSKDSDLIRHFQTLEQCRKRLDPKLDKSMLQDPLD